MIGWAQVSFIVAFIHVPWITLWKIIDKQSHTSKNTISGATRNAHPDTIYSKLKILFSFQGLHSGIQDLRVAPNV